VGHAAGAAGSEPVRPQRRGLTHPGGVSSDQNCLAPGRTGQRPTLTLYLILLQFSVFVAGTILGVDVLCPTSADLIRYGADWGPITRAGEWWRLITTTFLHVGALHLMLNMYCLWVLGGPVERLIGSASFLLIYLISGVTGSVATCWLGAGSVSVGSSGSIFGVGGVVMLSELKASSETNGAPERKRLPASMWACLTADLSIGAIIPNINIWAHLGGLLAGLACGASVALRPLSGGMVVRRLACLVGGAILVVVACVWALRIDDLEGALARVRRLESRADGAYQAVVAEAVAGRAQARETARAVEREVVARYREIAAEVDAVTRVDSGSTVRRDAIKRLACEGLFYWESVLGVLRDLARSDCEDVDVAPPSAPLVARDEGPSPPLLSDQHSALLQALPQPRRFFGDTSALGRAR
jgi:membrane associated rhomboid family serine protease